MPVHNIEFPFEEIRDENGDYFNSPQAAVKQGYSVDQIWSLHELDNIFTYGPSHHRINVLGFIATDEHHDGNTYYEEPEENFE